MNKDTITFEEEIEKHGNLVYTNKGDSMMPLLRQGRDLMVITRKPEGRLKRYDVPLYKRDNGQYVLHRILKVREKDYVICGDNRWQREYGITDRHIIGVLSAVVRDGKKIPVTNYKYRIYVHVWCDFFYIRAALLWLRALPRRIKGKIKK
ncbi:MAG: S24/S26 family peptidase [Eubacteriales bacterium]|nr:S24/S26 family peptidase [Eubacteriales bacterium]